MLRIIRAIEKATNLKPIPFKTTHIEKCIVYKFWQESALSHRLELRVIGFSFAEVEEISNKIINSICDYGDENKITGIPSIILNGGGIMDDIETKTIQRILYFDVVKEK